MCSDYKYAGLTSSANREDAKFEKCKILYRKEISLSFVHVVLINFEFGHFRLFDFGFVVVVVVVRLFIRFTFAEKGKEIYQV